MVSVSACSDQTEGGLRALRVSCSGRCHRPSELRPGAARLVLALDRAGGFLPKRAATRAIRPDAGEVLTAGHRASAARTITRLQTADFVERVDGDVWLTARARRLLAWQRGRIEKAAAQSGRFSLRWRSPE
jgi:hypothetical protein